MFENPTTLQDFLDLYVDEDEDVCISYDMRAINPDDPDLDDRLAQAYVYKVGVHPTDKCLEIFVTESLEIINVDFGRGFGNV